MKANLLIAALTLVSTSAFAGGSITVRSDYKNNGKYTNQANTDVNGTSEFASPFARMRFDGKMGEAMFFGSFNLIADSAGSGTGAYNPLSFVDYLYLTKSFGDFSVSAGRLDTEIGGFESHAAQMGDDYTRVLGAFGAAGALGFTSSANLYNIQSPGNLSGVSAAYGMGDHKVRFDVTNESNQLQGASVKKRSNMSLSYMGSMIDKALEIRAAYLSGAVDVAPDLIAQTFMQFGIKYSVAGFSGTVEYFDQTAKSNVTNAKANNTNTVYALVDYKIDAYKPFLKFETSKLKAQEDDDAVNSFKRTATTVGVEITPKAGDNFRYHFAYSNVADKAGAGSAGANATSTQSNLVAGIKWTGDMWK